MKEEFFRKVAKALWADFSDESKPLSPKEMESLKEPIIKLLSVKELVFYNERYKLLWNVLVEEGIVEPLYRPEAEEKIKLFLG